MKKTGIIAGAIFVAFLILFFWLASGASPDNAPQDIKTIELGTP